MSSTLWLEIGRRIQDAIHHPFAISGRRSVGGGSINQAYWISDGDQCFFVKLNRADKLEMFAAEILGLQDLEQTQTIRVPKPICVGTSEGYSYLVLEWLEVGKGATDWQLMGEQLAHLHHHHRATTAPPAFGWHRANTIGETPQHNPWTKDWRTFFIEHRLRFQLRLARQRGGSFPNEPEFFAAASQLLPPHPVPSLVHGDLWSGNATFTQTGLPVILDPAPYYGDREVDLAMTELFGGFPPAFYQGYQAVWPLAEGYERRKVLYNLYHVLNHFNLFGGSYQQQAQQMIRQITQYA
jgi:fructosamine-3-kinase